MVAIGERRDEPVAAAAAFQPIPLTLERPALTTEAVPGHAEGPVPPDVSLGELCAAWATVWWRYAGGETLGFGVRQGDALLPVQVPLSERTALGALFDAISGQLKVGDPTHAWRALGVDGDPATVCSSVVGASSPGVALGAELHDGRLKLTFDSARFRGPTMRRLVNHVSRVISALRETPDATVDDVALNSDDERAQLLHGFNATQVDFPSTSTLHELIIARAVEQPDALAVAADDGELTYGELVARASWLAHRLVALGVERDQLVGISASRGRQLPVAVLAVLMAGGAYVPLDPSYPAERLTVMLEDSGVEVLVTDAGVAARLPTHSARLVLLDDALSADVSDATPPDVEVAPTDLAYTIFTSGSTGRPKGAMVDHRGRINNFADFNRRFDVGPGDRTLCVSSLSFDMSAYDILGTLMAGAAVVITSDDARLEPARWDALMQRYRVTVWHSVPALLEMWVRWAADQERDVASAVRLVLLGGDWIPLSLLPAFERLIPGATHVSMGGATEVSMDSTIYVVDAIDPSWRSIPYGRPMANQRSYVLDARGRPCPIDVPGELFLGGVGVGRGYRGRPELTEARFTDNPFVDGERLYRTGDLARWDEDGVLELLGRADFQVKVGGHRIELGEIEAVIREHYLVDEVVVTASAERGAAKRVLAFVREDRQAMRELATSLSSSAAGSVSVEQARVEAVHQLRAALDVALPAYMIPSGIAFLEHFPLNANGKIDRGALPRPQLVTTGGGGAPPEDDVERVVASVWEGVLGAGGVPRDRTLSSLGGSSLMAVQVRSRLVELFGVELEAEPIFRGAVADVATALRNAAPKGLAEVCEVVLEVETMDEAALDRALAEEVAGG